MNWYKGLRTYQKIALVLFLSSFLCAVFSSLFPKTEYSFQETALQSWFGFMSFALPVVSGFIMLMGAINEQIYG